MRKPSSELLCKKERYNSCGIQFSLQFFFPCHHVFKFSLLWTKQIPPNVTAACFNLWPVHPATQTNTRTGACHTRSWFSSYIFVLTCLTCYLLHTLTHSVQSRYTQIERSQGDLNVHKHWLPAASGKLVHYFELGSS